MIALHSRCFYPVYGGFQASDYPPSKFIKAIKGQPVNGYANIPLLDGTKRKLTAQNPLLALAVFGQWAAAKIAELGVPAPTLVPIPSSDHTDPCDDFTAKKMCEAINHYAGGQYEIAACLTQRTAVLGSSKGGSRKFTDIRDNLHCHLNMAGKVAILIDDVATSGNHIKACATILRNDGATVDHAICAGRTAWDRPAEMWQVPVENIDWS